MTVRSALPDIAAGVNRGRDQAALIVPLLMAQLVLLAVVVLRLVLAAAIEQRRPEVALARMRGRGAAGARRLLIAELGATVLAGVPLGVVVAFALDEVARRAWLVPGVPFELPASAFVAALLAALVSLLTTLLATRRQPGSRCPPCCAGSLNAAAGGPWGWPMPSRWRSPSPGSWRWPAATCPGRSRWPPRCSSPSLSAWSRRTCSSPRPPSSGDGSSAVAVSPAA